MSRKHLYNIVKWGILLIAYAYLIYKLVTYKDYAAFATQWQLHNNWWWLIVVLALLPINWGVEASKWKYLVQEIETLSFKQAIISTLSGITTGFFTPARLGDYPGRSIYLKKGHRLTSVALGFVGSMAQNVVIMICGIPATICFFSVKDNNIAQWQILLIIGITLGVLLPFYFLLPSISNWWFKRGAKYEWLRDILEALSCFTGKKLCGILGFSALRYLVFCSQFFFLLQFFGVDLTIRNAMIGIATNYFFITFTPAIAFSEIAIRGSYAILFIGAFTNNLIGVTATGMGLWLINYCLPMIIGSIAFAKSSLK